MQKYGSRSNQSSNVSNQEVSGLYALKSFDSAGYSALLKTTQKTPIEPRREKSKDEYPALSISHSAYPEISDFNGSGKIIYVNYRNIKTETNSQEIEALLTPLVKC